MINLTINMVMCTTRPWIFYGSFNHFYGKINHNLLNHKTLVLSTTLYG